MIELLEELRKLAGEIAESSIDFAKEDLPVSVWSKDGEEYRIQPELKEKILDALSAYPYLDLLNIAKAVHVVGSIGTNLYREGADVDIHVVPDTDKLPTQNLEELQELQKDIMNWYKNNRDEFNYYADGFPFEVYLQLNPVQDYYSDTVYDLLSDEWLKPHKMYDLNYNPYEVYNSVFDEIQALTAPADVAIGEIRRDVIDYNRLMDAMKATTPEIREELEFYLEDKLEELKQDIEVLAQNKEVWRGVRHNNSIITADMTPDEVLEHIQELSQSEEWQHGNFLYKLIDLYQYMSITNNLKKLIDGDELSDEDVPKIEEILKDFNTL